MSNEVMSMCWKYPTETHTQKLVLICLADQANDEGLCWPSIATIARKCDLCVRSVSDQITALETMGIIHIETGGGHRSNRYKIKTFNPTEPGKPWWEQSPPPMQGVHGTPAPDAGGYSKPCRAALHRVHTIPNDPLVQPSLLDVPSKSKKPSAEEALLYGAKMGMKPHEVTAFMDHHEARGWKYKAGQPVVSWQAAMRTWRNNGEKWKTGNGVPVRTDWDALQKDIERL